MYEKCYFVTITIAKVIIFLKYNHYASNFFIFLARLLSPKSAKTL